MLRRGLIFVIKVNLFCPYEAEVRYAVKEYAQTAVDVISRRLRISFLNVKATEEALPRYLQQGPR